MPQTMTDSGKKVPFETDVVNYRTLPSAPLVIPVLVLVVAATFLLCLVIKMVRTLWTKQTKSDTYVFVEPESLDVPDDNSLVLVTRRNQTSDGHVTVDVHGEPNAPPAESDV